MNKDLVIHLARTAGMTDSPDDYHSHWTADDVEVLQRFADLVARQERTEILLSCEALRQDYLGALLFQGANALNALKEQIQSKKQE